MSDTDLKRSWIQKNVIWILLLLFAAALFFAYETYNFYVTHHTEIGAPSLGQTGDFFGGILNPLFAMLSFIALMITISLQSKELSISTDELAKSSKALQNQEVIMRLQHEAMELQNFEATFFQMLSLYNEIVDKLKLSERDGREVLTFHSNKLVGLMARDQITDFNRVEKVYCDFYRSNDDSLGHYFRTVYIIVKLIHESDVKDKKKYTRILRAQLSSSEQYLIFFNCLSRYGIEKFYPLINHYAFFENMSLKYLEDKCKFLLAAYEQGAYGDRINKDKIIQGVLNKHADQVLKEAQEFRKKVINGEISGLSS